MTANFLLQFKPKSLKYFYTLKRYFLPKCFTICPKSSYRHNENKYRKFNQTRVVDPGWNYSDPIYEGKKTIWIHKIQNLNFDSIQFVFLEVLYSLSCLVFKVQSQMTDDPDNRRPRWPNFKQTEEFYNITIFFFNLLQFV